jgi:hypothetical protein
MAEMKNAYKIFVRKSEEARLLRRPRSRWDDNIRMSLREMVWKMWNGCIWLRIGSSCVFL